MTGSESQGENVISIYFSHYLKLYDTALNITKNPEDAKDAVAETFFKLWKSRNTLTKRTHIEGFLYLVVRNLSIDQLRYGKKQTDLKNEIDLTLAENINGMHYTSREDLLINLFQEIDRLPPRCREVILMICSGKKTSQIAKEMGLSNKTVLVHKRNGVLKLHEALSRNDSMG